MRETELFLSGIKKTGNEMLSLKTSITQLSGIMEKQLRLEQAKNKFNPLSNSAGFPDLPPPGSTDGGESSIADAASLGMTAAGLGAALGPAFSASSAAGTGAVAVGFGAAGIGAAVAIPVAAIIFAIDQMIKDTQETINKENLAFQMTLQNRLQTAYQKQADDLARGVALAFPAYSEMFAKVTEQEEKVMIERGKGYWESMQHGNGPKEQFYEQNGARLEKMDHAIGASKGYEEMMQEQYQMDAKSLIMGDKNVETQFSSVAQNRFAEMGTQIRELEREAEELQNAIANASTPEIKEEYLLKYAAVGKQMESILIQADALAQSEWESSQKGKEIADMQNNTVKAVQEGLAINKEYFAAQLDLIKLAKNGYREVCETINMEKFLNDYENGIPGEEGYKKLYMEQGHSEEKADYYARIKNSYDEEVYDILCKKLNVENKLKNNELEEMKKYYLELGYTQKDAEYAARMRILLKVDSIEYPEYNFDNIISIFDDAGKIIKKHFDPILDYIGQKLDSSSPNGSGSMYDTPGVYSHPNPGTEYSFGVSYKLYDGYLAWLHEREKELTASEAKGSTGDVIVTGNTFTVREEADIDRIAAQLFEQIRKVCMVS